MAQKYHLFYTGTGPGQCDQIERSGYVFNRGEPTEVSKEVHDLLKGVDGFKSGNTPPAGWKPPDHLAPAAPPPDSD
jgi:hypothetical protein